MSQSLSKLYVHLVFHIKYNSITIRSEDKNHLYAYIGSIIKDNQSMSILINSTKDHLHILCVQPKNIALAKLVEEIKRHSSRWIKTSDPYYHQFAWQRAYAGFSVIPSYTGQDKENIANQEKHHKKVSFKEKLIAFLKEYNIEYDEHYLWSTKLAFQVN